MPPATAAASAAHEDLLAQYLSRHRERFKAEVNRLTRGDMAGMLEGHPEAGDLAFLMSYLYAWHWLRHNVHGDYLAEVLAPFRGPSRGFLMDLLRDADTERGFVAGYIEHWRRAPAGGPVQQEELLRLLAARGGDGERLADDVLALWAGLGLFTRSHAEAYRDLARDERGRYGDMLGPEDRERLALVDALPDAGGGEARFAKLGVIPAMGCPQTCRHCMFIWRPLMKDSRDPGDLYDLVSSLTDSVLFTGGDLTRHLGHFYRAIRTMAGVRTFAILLNGDFAEDPEVTGEVLAAMGAALAERPRDWPAATVLLQVSFDEFHQEVMVDKHGRLRERIPVAKIANIVEAAPRHPGIQLCLVHKQTALNLSTDVFHKGVFGRLASELGRRGHQVQVLSSAPSPRLKRDPRDPARQAPVLKDASFVLTAHPERPILLTSSTIDGYGRASTLDPGEAVAERDLLHQVLTQGPPPGEAFDTDLMFWLNGWVTLFNAVHLCLGNLYEDGPERVLRRQRTDPLTRALHRFDRRLLDHYAEVRGDLEARLAAATGPHHLFHALTEEAPVRLHMTRRLLEGAGAP